MTRSAFTLIVVMACTLGSGKLAAAADMSAPSPDLNVGWDSIWGKFDLKVSGDVELTADDSDVLRISAGGSLVVTDHGWIKTRQLQIDVDPSGTLKRRFTVNAVEQPFDQAAVRWFRDILPQLIERGGLAAESRAKRLVAAKGTDALVPEVSRFSSNWVKTLYVNQFVALAGPNPGGRSADDLVNAIDEISSNAAKGQILRAMLDRVPGNRGMLDVYLRVISQMDSSLEQSTALSALLQKTATDAVCLSVLPSVRHVSSAAAGTTVIELAAQRCTITPRFVTTYLEAVSQLSSADRQAHSLAALIDTHRLDAQQMDLVRDFSQNRVSSRVGRTMLAQKLAGQPPAKR